MGDLNALGGWDTNLVMNINRRMQEMREMQVM
jgi:hypothetical protein